MLIVFSVSRSQRRQYLEWSSVSSKSLRQGTFEFRSKSSLCHPCLLQSLGPQCCFSRRGSGTSTHTGPEGFKDLMGQLMGASSISTKGSEESWQHFSWKSLNLVQHASQHIAHDVQGSMNISVLSPVTEMYSCSSPHPRTLPQTLCPCLLPQSVVTVFKKACLFSCRMPSSHQPPPIHSRAAVSSLTNILPFLF